MKLKDFIEKYLDGELKTLSDGGETKKMNNNKPMYFYEDAIKFIRNKSKLNEDIISKVLELELEYMRSIGLVYEKED